MAILTKSHAVLFPEFSPAIIYILSKLAEVNRFGPTDLVITSANDGKHKVDSKHYKNLALDLRSKNFKDENAKFTFMVELKKALGPKFTVLYEYPGLVNEHFHVQVKRDEVFP